MATTTPNLNYIEVVRYNTKTGQPTVTKYQTENRYYSGYVTPADLAYYQKQAADSLALWQKEQANQAKLAQQSQQVLSESQALAQQQAAEAEARRQAELAFQQQQAAAQAEYERQLAASAEQQRIAAEQQRIANETLARQQAEQAEARRQAELAETQRQQAAQAEYERQLAASAEQQRVALEKQQQENAARIAAERGPEPRYQTITTSAGPRAIQIDNPNREGYVSPENFKLWQAPTDPSGVWTMKLPVLDPSKDTTVAEPIESPSGIKYYPVATLNKSTAQGFQAAWAQTQDPTQTSTYATPNELNVSFQRYKTQMPAAAYQTKLESQEDYWIENPVPGDSSVVPVTINGKQYIQNTNPYGAGYAGPRVYEDLKQEQQRRIEYNKKMAELAAAPAPGKEDYFDLGAGLASFDKFVNNTIGWRNVAAIVGSAVGGPLGATFARAAAGAVAGDSIEDIAKAAAITFATAYGVQALNQAMNQAVQTGVDSGIIDVADAGAYFEGAPDFVGPGSDLANFVESPIAPDIIDDLVGPPTNLANFGDEFFGPPVELAGISEPVVPGALTAGTPGTEGFTQAELNAIAEGSQMAAGPQAPGVQYAQSVQVLPGPEIATDVLPSPPPYFPEDIPNIEITGVGSTGVPVEPGPIADITGGTTGGISTPGGAISIGDVATVAVPVVGGAVAIGAGAGGGGGAPAPTPSTPSPIPPAEITPGPVTPVPPVEPPVAVQPAPVQPTPAPVEPAPIPPTEITPGPTTPVPPVEPPVAVQPTPTPAPVGPQPPVEIAPAPVQPAPAPAPAPTTPTPVDRITGPYGDIITYSDGSQYSVSNIPGSQPIQIAGPGGAPIDPTVVPSLPDAVVTPAPVEPVPTPAPTTPEVIVPPVVPPVTPAPAPVEPVPVQPTPTAPTTPTTPTAPAQPVQPTTPTTPPPSSEVVPPGQTPTQPVTTPGGPGQAPVTDYSQPYTGEYSNQSVLERYLSKQITYGDVLTLIAAGLVAPTVLGLLGGQPQQPGRRGYGPLAPIQWGEFQGGLTNPGLNPGYLTFAGQTPAFYNVDSPVAGRYYWGMHPYMRTAEDLAQYNVVPEAPAQPFGVLQPRQPLDINRFIRETIGTPEYQQAAMGGSTQYPGGFAPATSVAGGQIPQTNMAMPVAPSQMIAAPQQTQYLAPAQIPQITVPQVPQAQAQFAPVVAPPLTALPSWAPGQLDLTQPVAPFVPYTQATPA